DGALDYVWSSSPALGGVPALGVLSSPAIANDLIYIGTIEGALAAFSSASVAVPLSADVSFPGPVYASPAVSNGMVFVGAGGRLAAYRAARRASISSPGVDAVVSGSVEIKGYLSNPDLSGYILEYGQGEEPSSWVNIVSSAVSAPVEDGLLAVWDVSSLENGFYTLRLSVEGDTSGSDCTARVRVRVNAPPLPPPSLAVSDVAGDNGNKLRLTWSPSPSAGVTAYRIYREDEIDTTEYASVAAGELQYTDTAAITGVTFSYFLRSFDGYAESEDSDLVSAQSVNDLGDDIPPGAVTDLSAAPGSAPGSVLLSWTAPGDDGGTGTASRYVIKFASWVWAGFDDPSLSASERPVEGAAGDGVLQEISGLLGGVTYYFAVKTEDSVPNLSAISNIAGAPASRDMLPPQPPSGLTVSDTLWDDGNSLSLAWTLSTDDGAGADDVYGYRIYRRTQAAVYAASAPYAETGKGVGRYVDRSAPTNVKFYYAVSAFDSTGESPLSGEAGGISADNWRFFDASLGGSVRLPDGARVEIPGNAASQNDNIMFTKLDPGTLQPLAEVKANTSVKRTSIVYEIKFKNSTTRLLKPAVISLPYTSAEVAGMKEENLRIYTFVGGVWQLVNTSKPDTRAGRVTAEVDHFSLYAVMEYVPSGELLSSAEVYTYPNPARGDSLTFKFRPADKADVRIDVYNVAGEKVAKLEKA
ncbi:MAG TPA: PQQ-binding-like beta-propeller repeat protein, partial [Elusimicrobiales bacterium]|nr:PQQ-binding-like beta-propeller repeat protein [Elusimicrobiales bacterium]